MRKWRTIACLAVIAACLPGIWMASGQLPMGKHALIAEKYAGFSGVLRVWACESWADDSLAGWLNRCAARFEKAHEGVYIEIRQVDAAALTNMDTSGVRSPDMIIFPPGLIDSPAGLNALDELPVRASLASCGGGYAAPVALGGYAWAVNPEAEGEGIPPDEPCRRFSAVAQYFGRPDASMEEALPEPPGIDLGLPAFHTERAPVSEFMNGALGRLLVSQREVRRLMRLQEQGRGPDWTLQPGASAYTDQVLLMAVKGDGERAALSKEFIGLLLTADCQRELSKYGAFSVIDELTGYGANDPMLIIDLALHRADLTAPSAFNNPGGIP